MFGVNETWSVWVVVATAPIVFWELSLGLGDDHRQTRTAGREALIEGEHP
jgi:hypothetical protein